MTIKDYSTTPANNANAGRVSVPEGMAPGAVNDEIRDVMADVAEDYADDQWRILNVVASFTGATTFTVPGNLVTTLEVGRAIRIDDNGTLKYAKISGSAYTTLTTVTVSTLTLTGPINQISVGDLTETNDSLPDKVVTKTGTQTLTNKTLTSPTITPATVTGFDGGAITYFESDHGAVSTVMVDVDADISGSWRSVGPTGSGASLIAPVMDAIPVGAKAVIVKVYIDNTSTTTGARYTSSLYARKTGSTVSAGSGGTLIGRTSFYCANILDIGSCQTIAIIPIDSSRRFDLYFGYNVASDVFSDLYLAGFIM